MKKEKEEVMKEEVFLAALNADDLICVGKGRVMEAKEFWALPIEQQLAVRNGGSIEVSFARRIRVDPPYRWKLKKEFSGCFALGGPYGPMKSPASPARGGGKWFRG